MSWYYIVANHQGWQRDKDLWTAATRLLGTQKGEQLKMLSVWHIDYSEDLDVPSDVEPPSMDGMGYLVAHPKAKITRIDHAVSNHHQLAFERLCEMIEQLEGDIDEKRYA